MYCTRPASRSPSVYRIVSSAPTRQARKASFFPGFPSSQFVPPFFGRTASYDPFRALDRMMEDFSSPSFPFAPQQLVRQQQPSLPSFQPRFDVQEHEGTYQLRGELPGVESSNLEVEFTDPQTLTIRGRTERESSSGTPPDAVKSLKGKERATEIDAAAATEAEKPVDNSDAASTYSTGSYQKPSVEEDTDANETASQAQATPATTPGEPASQDQPQQEQQQQVSTRASEPQPRHWISERSTGSFQRVFNFPHKVDTEAVKANLQAGILSITVPKAAAPQPRRINVE